MKKDPENLVPGTGNLAHPLPMVEVSDRSLIDFAAHVLGLNPAEWADELRAKAGRYAARFAPWAITHFRFYDRDLGVKIVVKRLKVVRLLPYKRRGQAPR